VNFASETQVVLQLKTIPADTYASTYFVIARCLEKDYVIGKWVFSIHRA
jgi:hypothetical protein